MDSKTRADLQTFVGRYTSAGIIRNFRNSYDRVTDTDMKVSPSDYRRMSALIGISGAALGASLLLAGHKLGRSGESDERKWRGRIKRLGGSALKGAGALLGAGTGALAMYGLDDARNIAKNENKRRKSLD